MAWVQTARPGIAVALAEVARAPTELPDVSWAHPEAGLSAAVYGAAATREGGSLRAALTGLEIPQGLPARIPGPWFGAAAFSGALGPDWAGFPALQFRLPGLLAWTEGARHFLAAFGEGAQERLDKARAGLEDENARAGRTSVRLLSRSGERSRWSALVSRALAAIRSGTLDKVVIARAIDVEADAPLDPGALLTALEARYPSCRAFLLRGSGAVFLGATPEILCRVEGDQVQADALAGSARPEEAQALPGSGKDLREHRWWSST